MQGRLVAAASRARCPFFASELASAAVLLSRRKSDWLPAEKTDALPVEFRSVAADSFQSFGCAQLAAFHELGSNALDGAPHIGLAQDRIALCRIVGVPLRQLVVGSVWRHLEHSVDGVRIVAIIIVPALPTVLKDSEKLLVRVAIAT